MKKIISIFNKIIDILSIGFSQLCLFLSRGFFFYFYFLFYIISKIIRIKPFKSVTNFFKKLQSKPEAFASVALVCILSLFFYNNVYSTNKDTVFIKEDVVDEDKIKLKEIVGNEEESEDVREGLNLYRKFSSNYNIDSIDFSELKGINSDVAAWITVDRTNINYPVVKTSDNDYYLEHDINKNYTTNGWVFMDYRNNPNMTDKNTIFYGHNLLNKTSFGSISNLFTDKWFNKSNHRINIRTESGFYTYEVFSVYYIDPEVYYLQTNFYSDDKYQEFLNTLVSRSLYNFNVNVSTSDTIVTLSTCTEDNKNRKAIHARRVS